MGRIAKDFRRIKWRDVVTKKIMGSLECRPGRINNECAKAKKHQQGLRPPDIGPHRFAKGTSRQFGGSNGHNLRIMTRAAMSTQTERSGVELRSAQRLESPCSLQGTQAVSLCAQRGILPAVRSS